MEDIPVVAEMKVGGTLQGEENKAEKRKRLAEEKKAARKKRDEEKEAERAEKAAQKAAEREEKLKKKQDKQNMAAQNKQNKQMEAELKIQGIKKLINDYSKWFNEGWTALSGNILKMDFMYSPVSWLGGDENRNSLIVFKSKIKPIILAIEQCLREKVIDIDIDVTVNHNGVGLRADGEPDPNNMSMLSIKYELLPTDKKTFTETFNNLNKYYKKYNLAQINDYKRKKFRSSLSTPSIPDHDGVLSDIGGEGHGKPPGESFRYKQFVKVNISNIEHNLQRIISEPNKYFNLTID